MTYCQMVETYPFRTIYSKYLKIYMTMSEEELVESLVEYLIQESYADNEESALVLIEHMSEGALERNRTSSI